MRSSCARMAFRSLSLQHSGEMNAKHRTPWPGDQPCYCYIVEACARPCHAHEKRERRAEMTMKQLLIAVPALLVLSPVAAHAGETIEDAGALVCVTDKWDETEPEKGHKIANAAMRCV